MKISGLEKGILGVTAAFLLFTAGYFLGERGGGEPYTVSAETLWTEAAASSAQTGTGKSSDPTEKVNLNTATIGELESLPGIGQVRAEAIIADREENGSFRYPEELIRVPGIGQGTLEQIIDYITVE